MGCACGTYEVEQKCIQDLHEATCKKGSTSNISYIGEGKRHSEMEKYWSLIVMIKENLAE